MNTARHVPPKLYAHAATYDIATGILLDIDEFYWDGPVMWCGDKKGRKSAQEATADALGTAKTNSANQSQQYNLENQDLTGLEQTGPGGLGTGSGAYLANSLADISRNYANARAGVGRQNATRGFAFAPDAAFASGVNSANVAEAGSRNQAYNDALQLQRQNTLAAIQARSGLQSIYNPVPAENTALTGAQTINHLGSGWNDAFRGISTVAGLALAPMTGGASLALPAAFKGYSG